MWGYCSLGDLENTQLTASLLATSINLTRIELIHCCVLVFLWDKTFHLRGRPLKIPDILNNNKKKKSFHLAGKFAKTGQLKNSIASGSSWNWTDSLGFSLPKYIWAVRTSKRHLQAHWAVYKKLRPEELPKRDCKKATVRRQPYKPVKLAISCAMNSRSSFSSFPCWSGLLVIKLSWVISTPKRTHWFTTMDFRSKWQLTLICQWLPI